MSETGCGFQRAEDRHDPEWFCVVHLCWSSTADLCPLQRAEAAIKRVRELWTTCSCDRCTTNHLAILRALAVDGDSDEDGAE